jgi:HlyD family secretion protein
MEYQHAKAEAALQIEKMDFELQVRMIDLEKQNIKVREFQRQLNQLEITSPVNGMVGDLLVDQQSAVTKNQELMLVVDLSALEVEVDIPESYADDLDFGMKAQVSYNRETFTGTLTAISPEVNNGRVTGTIRFDEEAPQGLRQNQQLSTRIIIESREDVLKVKRGAFVQSGSGRYTYKVEGDLASRQTIKIGASSINEVEIVSGLREGDFIVTSDLSILGNAENVLLTQ